jgi:hypothetical protein
LTDYAALTETVSVPAASTNYGVVLYCPKNTTNGGNQVSLGGGYAATEPDLTVTSSYPTYNLSISRGIDTSTGWAVIVNNTSTAQAEPIAVRVMCADFDPSSAYGAGNSVQHGTAPGHPARILPGDSTRRR